ncbi:MAG: hypothetical protein R3C59_30950 [Planctomycetaceae bacterium]
MDNNKETTNNKPVKKFQLRGISASLFENKSENGSPFYKVSMTRTYRDGDEFKTTSAFGRDDLPIVAELSHAAWLEILKQKASANAKRS